MNRETGYLQPASLDIRRKAMRAWDATRRNKTRCRDLRRHNFEVETHLIAGCIAEWMAPFLDKRSVSISSLTSQRFMHNRSSFNPIRTQQFCLLQ
jgi:hypothetical protein